MPLQEFHGAVFIINRAISTRTNSLQPCAVVVTRLLRKYPVPLLIPVTASQPCDADVVTLL